VPHSTTGYFEGYFLPMVSLMRKVILLAMVGIVGACGSSSPGERRDAGSGGKADSLDIVKDVASPLFEVGSGDINADSGATEATGPIGPSACGTNEKQVGDGCVCIDGYARAAAGAPCTLPGSVACPDPALDGTVHYVCDCGTGSAGGCQAGNDTASGASPTTPWKSYAKAHATFASLPAGGVIAFCRGGSFTPSTSDDRHWVNSTCKAGQPCVIRDYTPPWATGELPRPVIRVDDDGNAFSLEDPGDPNHEEGYQFLNLDLSGGGKGGVGFFVYNDTDDVLMCNVRIDGFQIAVSIQGSNPPGTGDGDGKNERIVLRNSEITNNSGMGWLGAGNGSAVEYSRFDNNGFAEKVFNHNIYFGGEGSNERVVGNVLSRSAVVDGHCEAVSLVVHGVHDGLHIEGNTVSEPPGTAGAGCWGIAVDTGYSDAEAFRNVVIARNLVQDVGNLSIGISSCDHCVIEDNLVVQTQDGVAIAAPDRAGGSGDLTVDVVTIRNNSILYAPGVSGSAIWVGNEGTGHKVVSNAIRHGGPAGACFEAELPASAYAAFDYNLCLPPAAGTWAEGVGNLARWQAARGLDAHSSAVDPLFAAITASYDLSAASGSSPLVGAGDPVNSAILSFSGSARDTAPDIGAYER
jgi:hypothetical protein